MIEIIVTVRNCLNILKFVEDLHVCFFFADRIKRNSTRKDPPPARPPPVSNQNNAFDNTVTLRHKPSCKLQTSPKFEKRKSH